MRRMTMPLTAVLAGCAILAGCASGGERDRAATTDTTTYGGTTAAQVDDARLGQYVQVRRQLSSQDPAVEAAFASDDLARDENALTVLHAALEGSPMSVDEFLQIHRQVQSDPRLRARVEGALGAAPGAASGTSSPEAGTLPGWRGAPPDVAPPTTSSDPAPAASPQ